MELKADATGKAVVPILACVLGQLCQRNDQLPLNPNFVSKFHALRPPAIGIRDYLERIAKYAACSGECFVLALIYIDRIIQTNPQFVVNSLNIHRLLITSVMLGAKFFDDQYFNNAYYAKVGGVPCNEVNLLEVEFLFMTNFTLFVTTEQYRQYYTELQNHVLHSNCGCVRLNIKVPPLVFPKIEYASQMHELAQVAASSGMSAAAGGGGGIGFDEVGFDMDDLETEQTEDADEDDGDHMGGMGMGMGYGQHQSAAAVSSMHYGHAPVAVAPAAGGGAPGGQFYGTGAAGAAGAGGGAGAAMEDDGSPYIHSSGSPEVHVM